MDMIFMQMRQIYSFSPDNFFFFFLSKSLSLCGWSCLSQPGKSPLLAHNYESEEIFHLELFSAWEENKHHMKEAIKVLNLYQDAGLFDAYVWKDNPFQ